MNNIEDKKQKENNEMDNNNVHVSSIVAFLVSLATPVGEEEDSKLEDFIEDQNSPNPIVKTHQYRLQLELEKVLNTLTPREAEIIKLRYGIGVGYPSTLEEVGKKFGVTRERVRQIEAKAIRKLRHPTRCKSLKEYLD